MVTVDVGGVRLRSAVMAASGTFGYGTEVPLCDRELLGGMVSKGIFLAPRPGTPPPRIVETPSGMLNSIGVQGSGVDVVVRVNAPVWANTEVHPATAHPPGLPGIACGRRAGGRHRRHPHARGRRRVPRRGLPRRPGRPRDVRGPPRDRQGRRWPAPVRDPAAGARLTLLQSRR